ncbi:MAG: hypothetical protein WBQ62_08440 [Dehalococcoidales bacterium]
MKNKIRIVFLSLASVWIILSTSCTPSTTTTTNTNSLTTFTQVVQPSTQTSIISTVSPSQIMLVSQGASHGMNSPIDDAISQAIAVLVNNLGSPLSAAAVSQYQDPRNKPTDAETLMAVYSSPIDLRSGSGNLLTSTMLIIIQWNRGNNEPNLLFYGETPFLFNGIVQPGLTIDGGFQLNGNINALNQAVSSFMPAVVSNTVVVPSASH